MEIIANASSLPFFANTSKKPLQILQGLKKNAGIGLLSHVKMRSIMGDEALNFRVRNGIGCTRFSMDTKEIFQNI